LAIFAAIRRASSLLSNFVADRRPGFSANAHSFGPSIALVAGERLSCIPWGAITMKLRILNFLRPGLPLPSQDLESELLVVAGLRSQKLEEITELLSISPDADADEAVRIMKWWQETGAASTPAKKHADRLLREFRSLIELSLEIQREAEALLERTWGS
jgi:hypothetical protein